MPYLSWPASESLADQAVAQLLLMARLTTDKTHSPSFSFFLLLSIPLSIPISLSHCTTFHLNQKSSALALFIYPYLIGQLLLPAARNHTLLFIASGQLVCKLKPQQIPRITLTYLGGHRSSRR